jgi:hypothetical protein
LFSLTNIVIYYNIIIKNVKLAGHVACMEESRGAYRVLDGKPEGKNHLEDPGVHGRIILKSVFKK